MIRRLLFVLFVVFGFAQGVGADVRFYVVPKIGDGLHPSTAFRPKYTDPGVLGTGLDLTNWTAQDYGAENVMVLAADVTPEQHIALSAQVDVLAMPADLDSTISALALVTIQTKLETVNLPAEWLSTALTYRQALRTLLKIIKFAGRYQALQNGAWIFTGGVTLDTRWNQLTNPQQQALQTVAASFPLDTSGITNTMTLRQILRAVADQLPGFLMQGETF